MHNSKALAPAILLITLTIAPANAKRQGWGKPFGRDGQGSEHSGQFKLALDLSPQQEADLKGIHTTSKRERVSLREEAKANGEAIRRTFDAEVLDEPRLGELFSKKAELQADMMIAKHATREKVDQILTPEQQKKHEEFRQQRMKQKGHRRCEEPAAGEAEGQ